MNQQEMLKQIDTSIERYQQARRQSQYDDLSDLPDTLQNEILTSLAAAIDRLAPTSTRYYKNAQSAIEKYGADNSFILTILLGILKAMRADYSEGYLQTIQEIIHADIFSDFLEMAEYLMDNGFKDPGAVLVGGVLEEHLRKLCLKNNIPIMVSGRPQKADTMNSDLYSASIYTKLDHKSVTAWLDLRNKAAHGKYNEYTKEQVNLMLLGVRDFLTRFSA